MGSRRCRLFNCRSRASASFRDPYGLRPGGLNEAIFNLALLVGRLAVATLYLVASPASAAICSVPGSKRPRSSIGQAVEQPPGDGGRI
jgi:hypothetical protein